jgi:MFS family permease
MSTVLTGLSQRNLEHYPSNSQRIWYLTLAVVATIILYYESYVLSSVAPLVQKQFGLSLTNYVYVIVLANLLGAISSIFGSLSDRFGRANMVVYGLLVTGLVTIALSLTSSSAVFLLLYWILGFVEGIILVATPALVRDFSPRLGRATAMGFWTVGPVGGSVLATLVASATLTTSSWQTQYLIAGIVGMIVFFVCLFALRELSPGIRAQVMTSMRERELVESRAVNVDAAAATRHPWRQMLRPRTIFSAVGISVFLLIYYAAVAFFPLYLTTIFPFTLAQANGFVSVFWIVNVVAAIGIGLLSDRTVVRKPYMLLGTIATILVTILFITRIGQPTSGGLMTLFLALFGITIAVAYVTWMASYTETIENINPALVATGLAVWGSILRVVVVVSTLGLPIVVGKGQGWATWWWVCIAGMIVFIPTIFLNTGYWSPARARAETSAKEGTSEVSVEPSV